MLSKNVLCARTEHFLLSIKVHLYLPDNLLLGKLPNFASQN